MRRMGSPTTFFLPPPSDGRSWNMIEMVDVQLDHPRGGEPLVSEANLKVARGEVVMIVGAAGVGTTHGRGATLS